MNKHLLAALAVSIGIISHGPASTQAIKSSDAVIDTLEEKNLEEAKLLRSLEANLDTLTVGEKKNPILNTIHDNWRTFSPRFHMAFGKLLIASKIKNKTLHEGYRELKIYLVGTMYNDGKKVFHIEFSETEKGKYPELEIDYDYTGDVTLSDDILGVFRRLQLTYNSKTNELLFENIDMHVIYLGDGNIPDYISAAYDGNTPVSHINTKGVKYFQISYPEDNGDFVITLRFKDSTKPTQIKGNANSTKVSI